MIFQKMFGSKDNKKNLESEPPPAYQTSHTAQAIPFKDNLFTSAEDPRILTLPHSQNSSVSSSLKKH
jgi:hypothetical protein